MTFKCDFCSTPIPESSNGYTPELSNGYTAKSKLSVFANEQLLVEDDETGLWIPCSQCHELIDSEQYPELLQRMIRAHLSYAPRERVAPYCRIVIRAVFGIDVP